MSYYASFGFGRATRLTRPAAALACAEARGVSSYSTDFTERNPK